MSCSYSGETGNPVAGSLTWFSYVGGEDLRANCAPGTRDRYRFVYNGVYYLQVRSYDIVADRRELGASFQARVKRDFNAARGISLSDPFGNLRDVTFDGRMNGNELAAFRATALRDGLTAGGPPGLRLPSDEFYWVGMACLDGRFYLNAWAYPSDRFSALEFPKALLRFDESGVEFFAPRPDDERPDRAYPGGDRTPDRGGYRDFEFRLGANRLIGGSGLF
jgi:hypothetical protein